MSRLHLLNLDGCGVANEGAGHCESLNNSQIIFSRSRSEHFHLGRDVTDGSFDIVGDPLDEVTAVLVLDVEHLLVDLTNEEVEKEKKERILWIWFLFTSFMDMRPRNTAATVR